MWMNLNKIEPISTVDYPGKSACVIFFNGCNFKCGHCYNKQTWVGMNLISTDKVKAEISSYIPFISAVVFSGGEPTEQIEPLIELCKFSKEQGLIVGIETNGSHPEGLHRLKPYVDKIFLDLKAPINDCKKYAYITQKASAALTIKQTLRLDLPIEIRIVDLGNKQKIIDSLKDTKFKITILLFQKLNRGLT